MAELQLYRAGRACNLLDSNENMLNYSNNTHADVSTETFYDISGNPHSTLTNTNASSNYNNGKRGAINNGFLKGMTAYASADENFVSSDYSPNAIADVSCSTSNQSNISGIVYTCSIKNNGSNSATVKSIKFTKPINTGDVTTGGGWIDNTTCLICGVFGFDAFTLAPNETKTVVIQINFFDD